MNEQMELFPVEKDDRLVRLKEYLKFQHALYPFWFPSAKQIIEISNKFKVSGRKPLDIFEEILKKT